MDGRTDGWIPSCIAWHALACHLQAWHLICRHVASCSCQSHGMVQSHELHPTTPMGRRRAFLCRTVRLHRSPRSDGICPEFRTETRRLWREIFPNWRTEQLRSNYGEALAKGREDKAWRGVLGVFWVPQIDGHHGNRARKATCFGVFCSLEGASGVNPLIMSLVGQGFVERHVLIPSPARLLWVRWMLCWFAMCPPACGRPDPASPSDHTSPPAPIQIFGALPVPSPKRKGPWVQSRPPESAKVGQAERCGFVVWGGPSVGRNGVNMWPMAVFAR